MARPAKTASNTRNTRSNASTGRRSGRPSNASKLAAVHSQQSLMIDQAMAVASAAAKAALGIIEGGVTTIGIPQSSQSQSASGSTGSTGQSQTRSTARKSPGRKVQSDSAMTLTREYFAKNKNSMPRAELVRTAAEKFGYSKETGNTYISKIAKEEGFSFPTSRGGQGAARGRSRTSAKGNTGNQSQSNGTNG